MSAWTHRVTDPATGESEPALPLHSPGEVDRAVADARATFETWSARPLAERARTIAGLARPLRERREELALLMAREMGKPLAEGRGEIEKCAATCELVAERAEDWLRPVQLSSDASSSWVQYDPLGVVFAIMPWNFPFWQAIRFAAPAMVAGNSFLLKHAPSTPGCGDAISELFEGVGLRVPNLRLDLEQVERVIADPRVAAVTLTGSTGAGRSVAVTAARYLKRSVLELGGSDPFVVLDDADLDRAAEVGVQSRLLNGGQSCIAAKRFIVVRSVAEPMIERLRARLSAAVVGDPRDAGTTVGPMARQDLRDALHDQVLRSVGLGARCVLGGRVPDRAGWYYPPTLLLDVAPGMPAWDEELFGPVLPVRVVEDEDEALLAANDSAYALGASIWTEDAERARRWAGRVTAGCVFVNGLVKSDARLPFGGARDSGWGKELGPHGMRELTLARTVWVR
ncbi:MAG: NAD-dependent succinate-semialdehyde dehydrogenase [Myxococcales bacterium]|nr:NAD-dependent succinate-semialdehyde dehydrogenase [Myxococcales bacterium]